MQKATVTRLFLGGALAVTAGAILAIAAVWIAIENSAFVMNGPDIVGLDGAPSCGPCSSSGSPAHSP